MLKSHFRVIGFLIFWTLVSALQAQIRINEGSNRNFSAIADEDGDYPDWVELYNSGTDTINLFNYSISDNPSNITKWTFPAVNISPGEYKIIFCSGKNRKPFSSFVNVITAYNYNPSVGWNTHNFSTPFYWDGISNILINTCSYSSAGYTSNSGFYQSLTSYQSSVFNYQDGSDASCGASNGNTAFQRPNLKFNEVIVGSGTIQNSGTDYPAPYGNWYWGARNQMLIRASELTTAGLVAGPITSLSFNVAFTDPNTVYDYIEFHLKLVNDSSVTNQIQNLNLNSYLHTNFGIKAEGEKVSLYNPQQNLIDSLTIKVVGLNNSVGSFPDSSSARALFEVGSPGASNNVSVPCNGYALPPLFSINSGIFQSPIFISISNPNPVADSSKIYYTIDGSEPSINSTLYNGNPIPIFYSSVLKAASFVNGKIPSSVETGSYLFNIIHTTPILSVITDNANLYGSDGIFDNWWRDDDKHAYADYFDTSNNLVFSKNTTMQIDGGWGGSRSNPQHSFRLDFEDSPIGDGPVIYPLIPNRPNRTKYSQIYLRNGSNQYLRLPYKDAAQVMSMAGETNTYFSAWRPVSVYINGSYFGLYELREKFDKEYFETIEGALTNSTDILSLSAWYNYTLRALSGSLDTFSTYYNSFVNLNPADTSFWNAADKYFDLTSYADYIIAESWMGNTDWPQNNIKIYRSDKTNLRYRFCVIDLELSLNPNGWTDCVDDHIAYMLSSNPDNPYINIFLKSRQNQRFKNYFINRFADVMNTAYLPSRILEIENSMFNQTVLEMQKQYARWGDPNNIPQQMNEFYNNHLVLNDELACRSEQVRDHIQSNFNLPNQVDITLDVYPNEAGKIRISTILPESYPWNGIYFNGVPVKIEALANDGYVFSHWDTNASIIDTLSQVFLDTLRTEQNIFKAYFDVDATGLSQIKTTESNWILYPNPANSIITLCNKLGNEKIMGYSIIDIAGRQIKRERLYSAESKIQLDIQNLPAGVFTLDVVLQNNQSKQLMFVKYEE